MNLQERADALPESDLMQDQPHISDEDINIQDIPENVKSKPISKDQTIEITNTLEDGIDVASQQVDLAARQADAVDQQTGILKEHTAQLKSLNASITQIYKMLNKEFNKIEPRIDDRDRTTAAKAANADKGDFEDMFGNVRDLVDLRGRERSRGRQDRGRGRNTGRRRTPRKPGGGNGPRIKPRISPGAANATKGAVRFLGPAGAIAGAGMIGWSIGTYINERIINPTVDWATDGKNSSLGDFIYDKMHGDSGATSPAPAINADRIAQQANTKGLGSIAAHFESGNTGVHTVSTGQGDHGGVSYGKHQLSSKTGTMAAFLNSEHGEPFRIQFRGLRPGSAAFNEKYKEVAAKHPQEFERAQQEFMVATHYSPMADYIKKTTGFDVSSRSRAVQEVIYSVATQYGAGGTGKRFINEALKGVNLSTATDAQIISKIQDYRAASAMRFFSSSSESTRRSIVRRAQNEKAVALSMLNSETAPPEVAQTSSAVSVVPPTEAANVTTPNTVAQNTPPPVATQSPSNVVSHLPPVTQTNTQTNTQIAGDQTTSLAPTNVTSISQPSTPQLTQNSMQPVTQSQNELPLTVSEDAVSARIQRLNMEQSTANYTQNQMAGHQTSLAQTDTRIQNTSAPRTANISTINGGVTREYFGQQPTISTQPLTQTGISPVADPVVRQEYTDVQRVMAVDAPIIQPAPVQSPAPRASSGSTKESQKLAEFPAFMDDHGLLFITSGYI